MIKVRMFFRSFRNESERAPFDREMIVVPRIGEDIVLRDGSVWQVDRISHYPDSPVPVHLWVGRV